MDEKFLDGNLLADAAIPRHRDDDRSTPTPKAGARRRRGCPPGYRAYVPASDAYRITVVCLGNICRSPIGEVVLRDRVEKAGLSELVVVDSAGTGNWNLGEPANPRSVDVLAAAGYSIDHISRQITHEWFESLDLVLAMDTMNYTDLQRLARRTATDVDLRMMRSFDPALAGIHEPDEQLDVPDPYYGTRRDFVDVLHMVEIAADGLIAELPRRLNI